MKIYETGRLFAEPFLPPIYSQVRHKLSEMVKQNDPTPRILDVGGRKSPYTIGIPAQITVIDLPRESELQKSLNLGINPEILDKITARRSNVEQVVLGDMTCCDLPDKSFDIAVSVEVLEHIEKDELFVQEVSRVLKPGGVFLMTTPNGDWVENKNPDHKRHYLREQLDDLLHRHFAEVAVEYAVVGGRCRKMGLKSWSVRRPLQTAGSIFGNVVNTFQSAGENVKKQAAGTHHLIAVAVKSRKKNYQGLF